MRSATTPKVGKTAKAFLAAVVGVAGAVSVSGIDAAGALLPTAGIVDATVAVESRPVTVSPPGANVLYRVTASNKGTVPFDGATVTDLLPPGFTFRFSKGAPCSASGQTVTCTVGALAPGLSVVFDLVAQTSTTAGNYGNTVIIQPRGLAAALEYTDNNSATAATYVVASTATNVASAFVPGGGTLAFGAHLLKVPAQQYNAARTALVPVDGVIATLSLTDNHSAFTCGQVQCGEGLRVIYDEDPSYQVTDPDHPVAVDTTFSNDPCNGLTEKCADTYYRKPGMPAPAQVPACDGAGSGSNPGAGSARVGGSYHLCGDQIYKAGGLHVVVLMSSTDPDLLPPIRSAAGQATGGATG
ncbi:MAG TPA: hypothetical protein VM030_10950 [Acidimicrobiales bacterium]|nr:hypothetical protein [Acidimicrobiales bacterium]